MFSIRMRASKSSIHISGAEGIYKESEITIACESYIKRALTHSRGKPDEVVITIEKIKQKTKKIPLLPVTTRKCASPREARELISQGLGSLGISRKAVNNGFAVLNSKKTMRGASLILAKSGRHAEPDMDRGVRVSRIGMAKSAEKGLSEKLSKRKISTANFCRIKEALCIASKAAFCPDVIAEVCISDDPDYTTGYLASKKFGYLRIPNIKKKKAMNGGRAFFIAEAADISRLISYLERKPVIII